MNNKIYFALNFFSRLSLSRSQLPEPEKAIKYAVFSSITLNHSNETLNQLVAIVNRLPLPLLYSGKLNNLHVNDLTAAGVGVNFGLK